MLNVINDADSERIKRYFKKHGYPIDRKNVSIPEKESIQLTKNPISTAPPLDLSKMMNDDVNIELSEAVVSSGYVEWNKDDIADGLKADIENLAKNLLGEPNKMDHGEMRYGSKKGSLIINIGEKKRGLWYDHQIGEGGNPIKLIMHVKAMDFKAALDYAGDYLGLTPVKKHYPAKHISVRDLDHLNPVEIKRVRKARSLFLGSKPIKGTLAETYLKNERGITIDIPTQCRYHPAIYDRSTDKTYPALLVAGKDFQGRIVGVQVIYLDQKTGKKAAIEVNKRSHGLVKGAAVLINKGGPTIAVAEGPETALSIANADPNLTVFASLGSITNFSAIPFEAKGNMLIVCADNDGIENESNHKTSRAIKSLNDKGFNVFVAKPEIKGQDFNDVLQLEGRDSVLNAIKHSQLYQSAEIHPDKSKKKNIERVKKYDKDCEPELS